MIIMERKRKQKMSNIINAVINVINNPVLKLKSHYSNKNRANSSGDALEEYIKDLFSGSFNLSDEERLKRWSEIFSYLGNNNNPPDIILRGGDAIEVKKIESKDASLALNSSYPKHTLRKDSPMISNACRVCENWEEKDIIYTVRSEEHTSELQSRKYLVCRLLLEQQ